MAQVVHCPPRKLLICQSGKNSSLPGEWFTVGNNDTCDNFEPLQNITNKSRKDIVEDEGAIRLIPLTQNKFAIVDEEDYPYLSRFKWGVHRRKATNNIYYAVRRENRKCISMHRIIANAPDDLVVDHIDHNGLNNTKRNLRICTMAENLMNSLPRKGRSSKYKGVWFKKAQKRFYARVVYKNKVYSLGSFKDEIEAAKAYDKKAKELFGEFAYLNFPDGKE